METPEEKHEEISHADVLRLRLLKYIAQDPDDFIERLHEVYLKLWDIYKIERDAELYALAQEQAEYEEANPNLYDDDDWSDLPEYVEEAAEAEEDESKMQQSTKPQTPDSQ